MEALTITSVLSWLSSNWSVVATVGGALVSWIIPDKYKDEWSYKLGRKLSQTMVHKIGKTIWEPLELTFEKLVGRWFKGFFEGLNSDDFEVPVK